MERAQEGRQAEWAVGAASRRADRQGSEPAVLWVVLPDLPLMETGARKGQSSKLTAPSLCLAGGTLRPGAGINHRSSRDGCSLRRFHGVAENRVAECKSLGFAFRHSPVEQGGSNKLQQ